MVTEARDRGLPVYAETCPQYLFLSYDNYEEPGFEGAKWVCSTPLRSKHEPHQRDLWRGLRTNDVILAVGRTRVATVEEFQRATEGQAAFVVQIRRGNAMLVIPIR